MTSLQDALKGAGLNTDPLCPYCTKSAVLVGGEDMYPMRDDLHHLNFWACKGCQAYVGCHKGTTKPLGRLANIELRALKSQTHLIFDGLWLTERNVTDRQQARNAAYMWLALEMGLSSSLCHIGEFDDEQCRVAIQLLQKRVAELQSQLQLSA